MSYVMELILYVMVEEQWHVKDGKLDGKEDHNQDNGILVNSV